MTTNGTSVRLDFRSAFDMLDFVVEDVLVAGAEAPDAGQHRLVSGRARVGKERDQCHGSAVRHQRAGLMLRP